MFCCLFAVLDWQRQSKVTVWLPFQDGRATVKSERSAFSCRRLYCTDNMTFTANLELGHSLWGDTRFSTEELRQLFLYIYALFYTCCVHTITKLHFHPSSTQVSLEIHFSWLHQHGTAPLMIGSWSVWPTVLISWWPRGTIFFRQACMTT